MFEYFGQSPSARQFAFPTFAGRVAPTFSRPPYYSEPTIFALVSGPQELAAYQSYHYQIASPLAGQGIRDELTNTSLENPVPLPEDPGAPSPDRRSHSELLSDRIDASRQRYVTEAWEHLKNGDYLRSKGLFDTAVLVGPGDLEPQVGRLLCAAVDRQFTTATIYLTHMLEHQEGMFSAQYPFSEVFGEPKTGKTAVGEALLGRLALLTSTQKDSPGLAAIEAYLLWLDGQRMEALKAAEDLRDSFRTSPFAVMVDMMRQEMEGGGTADKKVGKLFG